jgi:hypothetical protein
MAYLPYTFWQARIRDGRAKWRGKKMSQLGQFATR